MRRSLIEVAFNNTPTARRFAGGLSTSRRGATFSAALSSTASASSFLSQAGVSPLDEPDDVFVRKSALAQRASSRLRGFVSMAGERMAGGRTK